GATGATGTAGPAGKDGRGGSGGGMVATGGTGSSATGSMDDAAASGRKLVSLDVSTVGSSVESNLSSDAGSKLGSTGRSRLRPPGRLPAESADGAISKENVPGAGAPVPAWASVPKSRPAPSRGLPAAGSGSAATAMYSPEAGS